MFGYPGGESQETAVCKAGYRDDAKRQWGCLTTLNLSQIRNEEQLISCEGPLKTAKADAEGWMAASSSNLLIGSGLDGCTSRPGRTISGDQSMATEFYVVRHHGAWRIRVNGKHHGEFGSRVLAINAAVTEAQSAGPGAKVFSTGIVSQFSDEWPSKNGANSLLP